MKYTFIATLFAFLCLSSVAMAQSDPNAKQINSKANTGLYVHYDKNTYISNETIWFTAYFLDSTKTTPEILSLFVVRHADKQIVADKKFVVGDFTAKGSITLPDSLQVGDYSIITYGNYLANDVPTYLHQQPISIKAPGRNLQSTMAISAGFEKGRSIKFKTYPEGGKLVANVEQLIAFEAIDSLSRPVQTRAVLMENGKVIDTIATNKEGFGRFKLSAITQNVYTIQSLNAMQIGIDTLNKAVESGVVLQITKALTKDTLQLTLKSTQKTNVRVEISNKLSLLEVIDNVEIDPAKILEIPLQNVPKGLQQIRVLDDNGDVLAERLFYAHYDKNTNKVQIETDKRQYDKRDSVTLSLMLPEGLDTLAQVSISVFHNNRMERSLFQDFEGQQYLKNDLRYWTEFKAGLDEALSEDLLLTNYKKTSTVKVIGKEARIEKYTAIAFKNKRALKKSINVNLMGDDGLEIITTDDGGYLEIPEEKMVVKDEKPVVLFATGYLEPIVSIKISDPYVKWNDHVLKSLIFPMTANIASPKLTADFLIDPSINLIEEVTIKAVKGDIYGLRPGINKDACGYFVCMYNTINCEIKGHNYYTRLPVPGETYLIRSMGIGVFSPYAAIKYRGCNVKKNSSMVRFPGFNLPSAFYHYKKVELDSGSPMYDSTLYWSPEILLQKNKTENFSFYVGDVPGRYTIIVQGISNKGFVYAESNFEILEN